MVSWAITFLLMALTAALFGFSGLVGDFATFSQFLTVTFIVLFLVSLCYALIYNDDHDDQINRGI